MDGGGRDGGGHRKKKARVSTTMLAADASKRKERQQIFHTLGCEGASPHPLTQCNQPLTYSLGHDYPVVLRHTHLHQNDHPSRTSD